MESSPNCNQGLGEWIPWSTFGWEGEFTGTNLWWALIFLFQFLFSCFLNSVFIFLFFHSFHFRFMCNRRLGLLMHVSSLQPCDRQYVQPKVGSKGWRWREKTHASSPSTSGKTHEKTCPIQTRRETRESITSSKSLTPGPTVTNPILRLVNLVLIGYGLDWAHLLMNLLCGGLSFSSEILFLLITFSNLWLE